MARGSHRFNHLSHAHNGVAPHNVHVAITSFLNKQISLTHRPVPGPRADYSLTEAAVNMASRHTAPSAPGDVPSGVPASPLEHPAPRKGGPAPIPIPSSTPQDTIAEPIRSVSTDLCRLCRRGSMGEWRCLLSRWLERGRFSHVCHISRRDNIGLLRKRSKWISWRHNGRRQQVRRNTPNGFCYSVLWR